MQTNALTTHTVTIDATDILTWLTANMNLLTPAIAEVHNPAIPDGRALEIVFPVSKDWLHGFLLNVIPDLPAIGQYSIEILFGTSLAARIKWVT